MQIINLLARLDSALAMLADDGPVIKRLDHLDEVLHKMWNESGGQAMDLSNKSALLHQEISRLTSMLDRYGPLLDRAEAMVNPGSVASAYVKGVTRRGHRKD